MLEHENLQIHKSGCNSSICSIDNDFNSECKILNYMCRVQEAQGDIVIAQTNRETESFSGDFHERV